VIVSGNLELHIENDVVISGTFRSLYLDRRQYVLCWRWVTSIKRSD